MSTLINNWLELEGVHKVIITPAVALDMLRYNTKNRGLRKTQVEYLATCMKEGSWIDFHPQTMSFSKTRLLDGAHRLNAVVKSGVTIRSICCFGCPDKSFKSIDTNVPRSYADRYQFADDIKRNKKLMSLVTQYYRLLVSGTTKKITDAGIVYVYENNMNWLHFISPYIPNKKGIGKSVYWLGMGLYYRKHPMEAEMFVYHFLRPDGEIQQASMLRDWAMRNMSLWNAGNESDCLRRCLYVCHCHYINREVNSVLKIKEETFSIYNPEYEKKGGKEAIGKQIDVVG